MPGKSFKYWIITDFCEHYHPFSEEYMTHYCGQQEKCPTTERLHWQCAITCKNKVSISFLKKNYCAKAHLEPSRSDAVREYVHKQETSVNGTRFEHGKLPIRTNVKEDWDKIKDMAKKGEWDNIPSSILVRNYNSLRNIHKDFSVPTETTKQCSLFWGKTGTGKTRRAYDEAKDQGAVYWKDSQTKWWDGYRGESTVIIDEFTGRIDISYILTWFDRYPCMVEVKGYSTPLLATRFFVTSNVNPRDWFEGINSAQRDGLMRRIYVENMIFNWIPPVDNSAFIPNLAGPDALQEALSLDFPNTPNPSPNPNLNTPASGGVEPPLIDTIFWEN